MCDGGLCPLFTADGAGGGTGTRSGAKIISSSRDKVLEQVAAMEVLLVETTVMNRHYWWSWK